MSLDDDEEERLRDRLKAKKEERLKSTKATTAATSSSSSPPTDAKKINGDSKSLDSSSKSQDEDRRGRDGGERRHSRGGHDRDRRMDHRRGSGGYRGPPPPGAIGGPYHSGRGYGPPPHPRDGGWGRGPPPPDYWRGGGPPPPYDRRGPPPPHHWRDDPYDDRRGGGGRPMDVDDFGRRRRPPPPRRPRSRSSSSRGRSSSSGRSGRSRSRSRSRSRTRSRSPRGRGRGRSRSRSRSSSSRSSRRSRSSRSRSASSKRSVSSSSSSDNEENGENPFTKDQRTVFVTQLVQRATERDMKSFFKSKGLKVNEVILLRDKRTGRHKGCAYVELRRMPDVSKAVALSGQPPNFQRFPVLVKASEAEKNYVTSKSQLTVTASQMGEAVNRTPLTDENGNRIEAQKVYVGGLSPAVTQEQVFALFSSFGQLEKVAMQMETSTGVSKGFCFLSFRDPKEANLAIQTMANQSVAGKPIKTGWANQVSSIAGVPVVKSEEFPPDAKAKATRAYQMLAQMTVGVDITNSNVAAAAMAPTAPAVGSASRIPTVAEARASLANGAIAAQQPTLMSPPVSAARAPPPPADPKQVGNAANPSKTVLVHNMFDKDVETEEGWEKELEEEFREEGSKFGKLVKVMVMAKEAGGKIYASFDTVQAAQSCAQTLAGRWFDKRMLRTEYVPDSQFPS